jgi:hypothetical protein
MLQYCGNYSTEQHIAVVSRTKGTHVRFLDPTQTLFAPSLTPLRSQKLAPYHRKEWRLFQEKQQRKASQYQATKAYTEHYIHQSKWCVDAKPWTLNLYTPKQQSENAYTEHFHINDVSMLLKMPRFEVAAGILKKIFRLKCC